MAAAQTQPIGKAFIVYGTVKAVAANGTERLLAPNSPIFAGERIVTGLALNDSQLLLAGAIPAIALALLSEVLFELIERAMRRSRA